LVSYVFFRFFGLFRNRSVCFGCFETGSKHRNKPKKIVIGFAKQTENEPKQIEFRFVSVRTEKKLFVSRTPYRNPSQVGTFIRSTVLPSWALSKWAANLFSAIVNTSKIACKTQNICFRNVHNVIFSATFFLVENIICKKHSYKTYCIFFEKYTLTVCSVRNLKSYKHYYYLCIYFFKSISLSERTFSEWTTKLWIDFILSN
jgi:hypothetical protein